MSVCLSDCLFVCLPVVCVRVCPKRAERNDRLILDCEDAVGAKTPPHCYTVHKALQVGAKRSPLSFLAVSFSAHQHTDVVAVANRLSMHARSLAPARPLARFWLEDAESYAPSLAWTAQAASKPRSSREAERDRDRVT